MFKAFVFITMMLLLAACNSETSTNEEGKTDKTHSHVSDKESQQQKNEKKKAEKGDKAEKKEAKYEINPDTASVQKLKGNKEEKPVVLLTIDDAPDKHSADIADQLHKLNASAIFFVNGHFLKNEENKKALKHIYDLGFMIGNHTMTHQNLKDLSEKEQKEEILGVNKMVEDVTGEKPAFFRAPFGSNTDYSEKLIKQEGMVKMNWTYGYDWETKYQSKDALTDIMVNSPYLTDGANLLMHDREWTDHAMPQIVTKLRDKGYKIIDPREIKQATE
ncbi:YfjS [Bacillus atrophaeus UCMB-5137]|uniref:polysaccharide deacetylase family protein n=1 Tax=Bacillus atrophaeus TaxID=1452 RepID=UPI0003312706|nr:polysaccharide deacetylase family protein [Bacillus atrophaeus]AKL84225.1 YfjS [Bacillus atrophaeus UCMB-5137]